MNPEEQSTESMAELIAMIWQGKWVVIASAAVTSVSAIVITLMLSDIYRSEVLLAPVDREAGGNLSGIAAQYSGIAGLAGINLGGQKVNKTALALEVLRSRKFLADFAIRHDILVPLLGAVDWDSKTDSLLLDSDVYDSESGEWQRDSGQRRQGPPSRQEAYEKLSKILYVQEDTKSGFVSIAIEFYSPEMAKQWLEWIVADLNKELMQLDVGEAQQAIAYLREQIDATAVADLRSMFYRLVEEQTKTVMLARVSSEYIFRTIDPPVTPEEKYRPRRAMIVVAAGCFGVMLGVLIVLLRNGARVARQ